PDPDTSPHQLTDAAPVNPGLDRHRGRLGLDRRELVHGLLGGRAGLSAPAARTASSPTAGAPSRRPAPSSTAAGLIHLPRHGGGPSSGAEIGGAFLGRGRRL